MLKTATISFGCPKNLVDSELMLGLLREKGFDCVSSLDDAEVIIVNTCAFIEAARRESLSAIRRLSAHKKKNCRLLVVAGCLVQYYGRQAPKAIPEADILLGVGQYSRLPLLLGPGADRAGASLFWEEEPVPLPLKSSPRLRSAPRHYAYLKIADGCDNRCSYCLIPRLRGRYRSRPLKEIVAEAARLAAEGVKELILVAQDTSSFGPEGRRQGALLQLLERLEGIDAVKWIRLLYAHPAHLREDVLRRMASSSKICSYLDLPIQHINDRLLARMGRPLSRSRLEALLDQVRELIPGISLRTALMVGFPGEGEEEFQELVEFVRWQRFDHLGVFAYSREKGTSSARLRGRVAAAVAARRRDKLLRMQKSISRARLRRYREKSLEVIIDGPFPDRGSELMVARGRFQSPEVDGVVVVEGGGLAPGDLVKVTIKESSAYDLYGVADR